MGVKYMQAWEEKKLERQEAFKEGLEEGIEKGQQKGREEGLKEGRFEMLGKLVQKGTLSLETAADQLDGKRDEFLNWYQTQWS